jgi:hypothetical protein
MKIGGGGVKEADLWACGPGYIAFVSRSNSSFFFLGEAYPRVTFLVNWWSVTPKPPNCAPIGDDVALRHTKASGYIIKADLEGEATQV